MENIVTLFKMLFFLKTVLITPTPIDIGNEWVTIKPSESLEAITGGAAIYIDVTKYAKPLDFDGVGNKFPPGTVEGKLIHKDKTETQLISSGSSHSNTDVRLIVSSAQPVPTDAEFIEVKLKSKIPLQSVNVYWKNGLH